MKSLQLANQPTALIGAEEIKILKQILWPKFTDPEVNYCTAICNQLQLNPLLKQIHFIKRNTKNGAVITAQTGIDGFRLTAERTGCYAGSDEPVFEYGVDKKKPIKATVTVYKMMQGQRCPFTASARWDEYSQSNDMWNKMAHNQLAKCAEALALRKAFPAELSALRSDEEMEQANGPSKAEDVQSRVMPKQSDIETTATQVAEPTEPSEPPELDEPVEHVCDLCGKTLLLSKAKTTWYCADFDDRSKGEHTRIKA